MSSPRSRFASLHRLGLLALAAGTLAACDDGLAPVADLSGEWVATRVESSVELDLAQHGTRVSGTGTWQKFINPPSGNLAADGTYLDNRLSLALRYDDGQTSRYTAVVVDPDHMVGSETYDGGATDSLTFVKQ